MRYVLTGLLWCVGVTLFGQSPEEELAEYKSRYPEEDRVITYTERRLTIEQEAGEWSIREDNYEEVFILTDQGAYAREMGVQYSTFHPLVELEAYTLVPGSRKYKQSDVEEFTEKDVLEGPNFYDDVKERNFAYPDLVEGAKRVLRNVHTVEDPLFLPGFYLIEYAPVEKAVFEIVADEEVAIGFKTFHTEDLDLEFSKESKRGQVIYRWEARDVPKYEPEGGSPSSTYFGPHILARVESYTKEDGTVESVVNGVQGLSAYYEGFLEGINVEDSEELKALSDSITQSATTDLEKVKAIYQWVQDNIKYVAFEAGYMGLIPRQAADIYRKRFGDCKDMASIQQALMKHQGIEGHWTWIGSRSIPYDYTDFACVQVDNHMILTYREEGKTFFLDGTSSYIPFGIPSSFIQGKEALIRLAPDSFIVERVPVVPAQTNTLVDSVKVTWNGSRLEGEGKGLFTGYLRRRGARLLDGLSQDEKRQRLKKFFEKGSNKFFITSFEDSKEVNKNKPYIIDYSFYVEDYVIALDDELYINLNLDRPFRSSRIEEDRKWPYERDYKGTYKNVVTFDIPEGYEVAEMPENTVHEHELFRFASTYSYDASIRQVVLTVALEIDYLILEASDVADWNAFIDAINESYKQTLILNKPS